MPHTIRRPSWLFMLPWMVSTMAGCNAQVDSPTGTGSIAAQVIWPDQRQLQQSYFPGPGNQNYLLPADVATVTLTVSGTDMADLQATFAAASGGGTLTNVPVGNLNRTLTVQGYLGDTTLAYQSITNNLTVATGAPTAVVATMQPQIMNATGLLDTTFGGSAGFVVVDSSLNGAATDSNDSAHGITVDALGRILIAGYSTTTAGQTNTFFWRYNADGSFDTYGDTGWAVFEAAVPYGSINYRAGITTDASGRILLASRVWNGTDHDMAVFRFTAAGALDSTFGTGGRVFHNNAAGGNLNDEGVDLAVNALTGKIVVAGKSWNGSIYDLALWQFNEDGSPDTFFGVDGVYALNAPSGVQESPRRMALDSLGRIYVTGEVYGNVALWRFTATGLVDTTFGGDFYPADGTKDGLVTHHNAAGGNGSDNGDGLTIDASGRILVVGSSLSSYSTPGTDIYDMALWKFNNDGTLFTGFGGGTGYMTQHNAAGGGKGDWGESVAVDSIGRIIVTGSSFPASGAEDMVVWRYLADGTLDTNFGGGDGIVTSNGAAGGFWWDFGHGVIMDALGRILVVGHGLGANGNDDAVIWRYR